MEYINKNRSCVFLALSSSIQFNKHIEEMQENRHFLWCGHGEGRAWCLQRSHHQAYAVPQCLLGKTVGFVVT